MTRITTDNIAEIDEQITDVCEGVSQDLADLCSVGWLSDVDTGQLRAYINMISLLPSKIKRHLEHDFHALSLVIVGEQMQEIAKAINEVMIRYREEGSDHLLMCTGILRHAGCLE